MKQNDAMNRRDIFGELTEGFDALEQSREGKITLQTSTLEVKEPRQARSGIGDLDALD